MSYKVRTESFEGPFDLLLYLVSRQRVDIGAISIAQIADQYLQEVARMGALDLDVASDFLLVASTLLEIKAASLIPSAQADVDEELGEMDPVQARDALIARLIAYKQFKNAAAYLGERSELQEMMHVRGFGPEKSLMTLVPDYLEGITPDALGCLCAQIMGNRDPFLLESGHIAAKPIPVELHVRAIHSRLKSQKELVFGQLVRENPQTPLVVVSFLAVLELFKRGMVTIEQDAPFAEMRIRYVEGSGELFLDGGDSVTSVAEE